MARVTKSLSITDLDAATRRIKQLKADIGRSFYELGAELNRVKSAELFKAKDYESFDDYLETEVQFSRATAYRFMRIASTFGKKFALEAGPAKLDAALRYIAATPEDESPDEIPDLVIPVRKNGRTSKKRLVDASHREIDEATRTVRRGKPRARPAGAANADALVARVNDALERAKLGDVRVVVAWSTRAKRHVLTVEGIDVERAYHAFSVLAKAAAR